MALNSYFTVMIVPEREKGVKSFRVPKIFFRAALFIMTIALITLSVIIYDYWKILRQVYENQHLNIENRQLKEQIQLFQMKINTLEEDIGRIRTFERKLKVITGLDNANLERPLLPDSDSNEDLKNLPKDHVHEENSPEYSEKKFQKKSSSVFHHPHTEKDVDPDYVNLKNLYEQKIAAHFGMATGHRYTREWSELFKQSFGLADRYASFDYSYNSLKDEARDLESDIHELDQFLLDKESFLRSTPTLLPTKGWITSNYGPRISPTSKRLRMHEGIDIGARTGTAIVSPADGTITFSGSKPGFGNIIQVDHGYGVQTVYAHAKQLKVERGKKVKRGDVIALIGNTGSSTGPHLHYEVRINGTPVDPLFYTLD